LVINEQILKKLSEGDFKTIAQCISYVENEPIIAYDFLSQLNTSNRTKTIGITGAPGAGKSSLVNAMLHQLISQQKRVAVLSVDPSSPFNLGALLGDRIRMVEFYLNPNVYIRSLASRGALGGLHPKIIEIIDVIKAAPFDYVFIETVGVGQSEIEIAGIADTTVVVVVPEGGDEIQTMKAGVMEIADIFVVNKCDRPTATTFVKNLSALAHSKPFNNWTIPVIKTVATKFEGIVSLIEKLEDHQHFNSINDSRRQLLLTQKALQLIQQQKLKDLPVQNIMADLETQSKHPDFNLYKFVKQY
jgi:LAO/AO transport system kinase